MAANQAEVDLIVNAAGALPDLERQLSQIVRTAENGAPEVGLEAGLDARQTLRSLDQDLARVVSAVQSDPSLNINLEAVLDQRETIRNIDRGVARAIQAVQAGAPAIDVEAELDSGSLASLQASVAAAVQAVERTAPDIEIDVDVDTDQLPRAERAIRALGRGAVVSARGVGTLTGGVAALSLGAGGLANTLAAVVAAAQQVAPAVAVGTSAMLTQKLVAGTLKLALIGVEDAIKGAFDPELTPDEFHKSLEGLAPEAAKFADALHTMRRELKAVQQGVQNRVFKDFDEIVTNLAQKIGPTLTASLNRTANSLNAMGRNAATAALQLSQQGVLGQALEGANTALETLAKTPARVVRSFGFLAAASTPALNRIALAVDDISLKISQKLQRAFESGALEQAIDQAVSTLAQLGTVLSNFGSGISNIFGGLTQDGSGLFDVLEKVSGAFERLTASREFQVILNELSLTAGVLVDNILPLIQEAFIQLGPVIEELAPVVRDFVTAIGPELIPIIQQLGPILVDIALILQEQLPTAIELASAAISALGVALDIITGIVDVARQGAEVFSDFMESDFAQAMGAASDAAIENGDEIQSAFIAWTADAGRAVQSFQGELADFSANARDTLVSGFVSAFNETISNIRSFIGIVIGELAGLPDRFFAIGAQVMSGFAGGLTSGIANVLGIAQGIADSVTSTIKGALDIRSPSRVMAKLGRNTVQGFIEGIEVEIPNLRRTVARAFDPNAPIPFILTPGTIGLTGDEDRFRLATFSDRNAPVVNVYVGGELMNQIIDSRIQVQMQRRDQMLAQGRRI